MEHKQIGVFSQDVINLLDLDIRAGTPIYIGQTNIEHIKKRHPYDYDVYFNKIEDIRVAIRVTPNGIPFLKSLHLLSSYNAERYINRGTLKKLDKKLK